MTTTDQSNSNDTDLALTLQANQSEYHIAGAITSAVHTREGQCILGPSAVGQLNSRGTSDVSFHLQCPRDEAILQGSIQWVCEGRVAVITAATGAEVVWQTAGQPGNGAVQFNCGPNAVNNNAAAPAVNIPPHVVSSQFTQIDIETGDTPSLNRHLAQVSASECGAGALSAVNAYLNETANPGYYALNSTTVAGLVHRHGLALNRSTDVFNCVERVHHQINLPFSMLCSWDYDDNHTRKQYPRGMSLRIRCSTRNWQSRSRLATSQDGLHYAHIVWTKVTIKYTTATVPDGAHRQAEPLETVFATLDMGIRMYQPEANNPHMTIHITTSPTEFIPQWVIVWLAPADCFDVERMRDTVAGMRCVAGAIANIRCNLNGDMTPDFMAIYQDGQITLADEYQRTTMYNGFLGRLGFLPGRSREGERSMAERQILAYGGQGEGPERAEKPICSAGIVLTDPSMTLVREASSGALAGALSLQVQIAPQAQAAGQVPSKLVVICITKQQIAFKKAREPEGAPPTYTLSRTSTRPAFTQLAVVDQAAFESFE
uniref:LO7 n=1 Tax=Grenadier adomavirus TaxID=2609868 RepID=A0A6F9EY55_9VIRU|nr:TPA_asm: LO7 [Grenadier adomavirus]